MSNTDYTRTFLDLPYIKEEVMSLYKKDFHHELNVLRKRVGDRFTVFDGKGNSALAEILDIDKKILKILIIENYPVSNRHGIQINLGQSLIKNDPFNLTIQKATELGVGNFSPLLTERVTANRTNVNLEKRIEKWNQIAKGACEQCGENWIPEITEPLKIEDWSKVINSDIKIVLYPEAEIMLSEIEIKDSISIAIGPEGDFTEEEIRGLKEDGFIPVTIGPRILRAETAAISVISALRYGAKEF